MEEQKQLIETNRQAFNQDFGRFSNFNLQGLAEAENLQKELSELRIKYKRTRLTKD